LQDIGRDSEAATREPTEEGAREGVSFGFDTGSATSVDLSDKEDGAVDPSDMQ
jgi:hypothetical protein